MVDRAQTRFEFAFVALACMRSALAELRRLEATALAAPMPQRQYAVEVLDAATRALALAMHAVQENGCEIPSHVRWVGMEPVDRRSGGD